MRAGRAAFALAALCGCRGGGVARPAGAAGEGRSVVIHAGRDGGTQGRAHVDERRWREVPASGELDLGPVAGGLELDSVVVESVSDPGGVLARSCQVVSVADGLAEPAWLWGRTITAALADGSTVRGEVVEVGEPVAVIDDGEIRTRVPLLAVHHDRGDGDGPPNAPRPGDDVYAIDADGEEVFGTFAAIVPDRLVLRVGGAARTVDADTISRISVAGVPAEPTLRCAVESRHPGRHLVRVAYATPGLSWRAGYQILVGAADTALDHVMLAPAFDITADDLPAPWPAHVRLVLGVPAEPEPPLTVWEGEATLGGGTVHVAGPPVRRRARLDLIYRGAEGSEGESPRYPDWHDASGRTIWRELALERLPVDAAGPLRVGVRDAAPDGAIRWLDGTIPPLATDASPVVRVALAPDPDLVGFRRKVSRDPDGTMIIDDVAFSVANRGTTTRTVIVEEPLRNVARPTLLYTRIGDGDAPSELLRDRWRATLTLPAGALVQGQVVLQYRFKRY